MITLGILNDLEGVRHAFFTRNGGASEGLYASNNCGFGSGDLAACVAENRRRSMARLDLPAEALVTVHQVHGREVATVERPWPHAEAPKADAMVTNRPGVALGILGADCAPVLFVDPEARVIGAAHAGWRGALAGVTDATVAAMTKLGALPKRIYAVIGPCIAQRSYEVGPEFPRPFLAESPANADFFAPSARAGHLMFDLVGYLGRRLGTLDLHFVSGVPYDTCREEDRFFSYRRATLRGEKDYGRNLSAIALEG
ncbi:MAG: peptidoglycan editing factor PgeF [Alphaproteobacteria bacterium]|nr:peptidoglycan editing factor PgeF [Alphaproteobacteria bacterium]